MPDTVPLSTLVPGAVFRTADGLLWQWDGGRRIIGGRAFYRAVGRVGHELAAPLDTPVTPLDIAALERDRDDALAVLHDYATNGDSAYSAGFLHGFEEGKGAAVGVVARGKWPVMPGSGMLASLTAAICALRPIVTHAPPCRRLLERCREQLSNNGYILTGTDTNAALLADIDAALVGKIT
jgi:hypothetical protein